MIRKLFTALGPRNGRLLRRLLALQITAATLQGLAFALLVPALRELLGGDPERAWPWVIALAGTWLAYACVDIPATIYAYQTSAKIIRGLYHRIGDKVAGLPLAWFTPDRVGPLGRLAGQRVMAIMSVPAHLLRQLVDAYVTPLVVVLATFVFDWRLALALTASSVAVAVVYRQAGRWMIAADRGADRIHSAAAGRVVEFARAQPVLRAFGRTVDGNKTLTDALTAQHSAGRRLLRAALPGMVGLGFVAQAAFTTLLVLGTYLTLGGSMAAPELIALLALAARFVEPVMKTAELSGALRMADSALTDINTLLATETLPEPAEPRTPNGSDIELDAVTFGYDGTPVLRGLSLRVPPRGMTALVGPSGSGKSTVIKLISRFFDADSGAVRVGGIDVREMRSHDLTAAISVVFQDVYLFDGSILDNVRVGRPDATDAEVLAAARAARVDEIADRLPGGWDAPVGDAGSRLSGGERQRVSIARALLKDAPIVLFDEATAALDIDNEYALQQAISALATDRTVLVIAHRLQTIRNADQIVVLADGTAAETGTHDELLAKDGHYARYWYERSRAAGWRLTTRNTDLATTP